jgi:hypothetical protein
MTISEASIITMKKWGDLQLALQLGFELQWQFATPSNSMYFYQHECYWTHHMSCNGCNSSHTYAIHAIQL